MVGLTGYAKSLFLFNNKGGANSFEDREGQVADARRETSKLNNKVVMKHFLASFQFMAIPVGGPLVASQVALSSR